MKLSPPLVARVLILGRVLPAQTAPQAGGKADWPCWRGPLRNGHADPTQKLPPALDPGKHTLWEAPVPGRGHGSPIVVGDRIYLVTADE